MRLALLLLIGMVSAFVTPVAGASPEFVLKGSRILLDANDYEVVSVAADLFSEDVRMVTGESIPVTTLQDGGSKTALIFGTVGSSLPVDRLVASGKIDVSAIEGGWERYQIEIVNHPLPGISRALVVVGSDRRGTAYGIFHLSRMIGVSP